MSERERERDANDEETAAPHPPLKVRGSRGETGGGVGISKRERERECPRVVVAKKKTVRGVCRCAIGALMHLFATALDLHPPTSGPGNSEHHR